MGAYAAVADVRSEGIAAAVADDPRVEALLEMVSRYIDRVTGLWFERREDLTLKLDGSGTPTLELPAPLLEIASVIVDGQDMPSEAYINRNQRELDDFLYPRLEWATPSAWWWLETTQSPAGRWPRGQQNVVITGDWGWTEEHEDEEEGPPPLIRRACTLLVVNLARPAGQSDARFANFLRSERLGNYSYDFGDRGAGELLSGDSEVDEILARYTRVALGAA